MSWLFDFLGLTGIKIRPYDVSPIEQEALYYDVHKGQLTGNYKDLKDLGIELSKQDIEALNKIYGTLNKKYLDELMRSGKTYRVQMPIDQEIEAAKELKAKIYIATRKGLKYYCTSEERTELLKLGIKNVFIQTDKKKGFTR